MLTNIMLAVRTNTWERVVIKMFTQLFTIPATVLAGLLFTFTAVPALASLDCGSLKGCDRKFCEIENQLNIAEEKGNDRKAAGLAKALAEANLHCTDEDLREDLVEEIDEAKEDLAAYEADLKEAEEDGDMDDVRKYQKKIEEEKNEIKHLENELSNLD